MFKKLQRHIYKIEIISSEYTNGGDFAKYDPQNGTWEDEF